MMKLSGIVTSSFLLMVTSQCCVSYAAPSKIHSQPTPQIKHTPSNNVKLNFNSATAKQISKAIKGFGRKRAEAIVAYRDKKGKIRNFDELAEVSGISQSLVNKTKSQLQEKFYLERR